MPGAAHTFSRCQLAANCRHPVAANPCATPAPRDSRSQNKSPRAASRSASFRYAALAADRVMRGHIGRAPARCTGWCRPSHIGRNRIGNQRNVSDGGFHHPAADHPPVAAGQDGPASAAPSRPAKIRAPACSRSDSRGRIAGSTGTHPATEATAASRPSPASALKAMRVAAGGSKR